MVARAAAAGLKTIALTDHDTVEGVDEALAAAPPGLTVIAGAELSSVYRGREVHVLAYFLDHHDARLLAYLEPLRSERRVRAERIVARLSDLGVPVTLDDVIAVAREDGAPARSALGRPHIAEAIVRKKAARNLDDAFARYLRRGQPAYVPKPSLPLAETVRFVNDHGGVTVIAHPGLNLSETDTQSLAGEGLAGIEVWHPKHSEEQRRSLAAIAQGLGVIATGGSDYHGPARSRHDVGACGVTLETVGQLRLRAARPR